MNTICSTNNRKFLFTSIACLFFIFVEHVLLAQEFKGVLILGASAAQIDGDDLGGFDKAGFQIGGGVSFPINEKFNIQPEILFSQKGSKARKNEPYFNWQLNYIDMPLLVTYKINDDFDVHLGAGANYLLSARFDAGFGFTDQSEAFKTIDATINGGAEYHLSELLSLNVRVTSSIVSAGKFQQYYNRTIQFTIRYHLLPK